MNIEDLYWSTFHNILLRLIVCCGGILFPTLTFSSDWSNFIINYNKSLYGKGAQTWQVSMYEENWVYFANQNGMLQYDGNSWNIFRLNNNSDLRSILPSTVQKRIYAGAINEFGYFEPDDSGRLIYTCLSDSISDAEQTIGNIWGIHEADNILYIQGDNRIIKYLDGKFTIIDAGCKIDCSNMVNGVLYIGTDRGVMVLIGNTLFPLQGAEKLTTKRIRGIIPYHVGVVVVTADGLFHCNGEQCIPFVTGLEDFFVQNEIFCVATSDECIALGTVHKGIVVIDYKTFDVKYFNENNGLQNNTVLSLAFDAQRNLWAGLDYGIDYICLNSPLTTLYTYPNSYGTGYDAILSGEYLYLGTNRGLYYTKYPVISNSDRPDIRPVSHSSGQVWRLQEIGGELFCLHDRGMFLVQGLSLKRIGQLNGTWACQLVAGTDNKMFVGLYNGLYLLEKQGGEWIASYRIAGTSDSFRFFEQESAQVIWMSGLNKCTRIELDGDLTKVVKQTQFDISNGLSSEQKVRVNKVGGKIYFSTPDGVYQYNAYTQKMEYAQEINSQLNGTASSYYCVKEYNNHIFGLNQREICISNLITYKVGAATFVLPLEMPAVELVQGAETLIPLSDSLLIIPNESGFSLAKVPDRKLRKVHDKVCIRRAYLSYPQDSLIYTSNFLGIKSKPIVPYSHNAVRFEYGITSFTHGEEVSYQYRLNNDEWSASTKSTVKEYSNLREGHYLFEVKAVFPDSMSAVDTFVFQVLPPWYRTPVAYMSYFALLLILFWFLYKWDDVRVEREKEQVAIEKDKEIQEKEKEFEEENARKERQIIQLEKEKLEHDLHYKSQEMANLMINFVRKNEILTEIKSDLFKVISEAKAGKGRDVRQMLLVVSNKIDSNINSDKVLKRIEEQFDLVHNNFMRHLQERHPDLSINERIMCAYIKMNLSTKEIAPLLNISIRGVETIRYRIRKKLQLEREDNLTDYLNSNF